MKKFRSKISFKAVIIGALIDVIGTTIWAVILVAYIMVAYHLSSVPNQELSHAIIKIKDNNLTLKLLDWTVGGGFSIIGGYVAAYIAKKNVLLNAILASFLCIFFAIFSFTSGNKNLLQIVIAIIGNPILDLIGGYIYLWRVSKKSHHKS